MSTADSTSTRASVERIAAATAVIEPVFLNTPQFVRLVTEPAGAAAVAAVLAHRDRFCGQRLATLLTGGNITPEQARWLA